MRSVKRPMTTRHGCSSMNSDRTEKLPVETPAVCIAAAPYGGAGGSGTAARWHSRFNSLWRYFQLLRISGWKYFRCATVPVCQRLKQRWFPFRLLLLPTERERWRHSFQQAVNRNREASSALHAAIRLARAERMAVNAVVLVPGDRSGE